MADGICYNELDEQNTTCQGHRHSIAFSTAIPRHLPRKPEGRRNQSITASPRLSHMCVCVLSFNTRILKYLQQDHKTEASRGRMIMLMRLTQDILGSDENRNSEFIRKERCKYSATQRLS